MQVKDYISCFERRELESTWNPSSTNMIVLPQEFYQSTRQMVEVPRETRGFMLAKPVRHDESISYLVVYLQTLGIGDSFSVYPNEERLVAAQKLHAAHPYLQAIDFHTHTRATGEPFQRCFSGKDCAVLESMFAKNPNYKHVLFTPTSVLTFGSDRPSFGVARNANPTALQLQEFYTREFKGLLRN